uniref:MLO-like protein n=2 Tax=Kalanchoe fedtschenkoi TaxID=63787 RepID=A0A7N0UES4_KALFE
MADYKKERTLEGTPTWAVAVVCFVLVAISLVIEKLIHHLGHFLKRKNKPALVEALEKIKAELMLLGFISLLLVVLGGPISQICVPQHLGNSWRPCGKLDEKKVEKGYKNDYCTKNLAFVSSYGIHQLHIFIFVLALFHVTYCIMTLGFGSIKMRKWKIWENETKTIEYQYSNDPERFRFARDTSFGRRHLNSWSQSTVLLWIQCFFRQFFQSVTKVDYLTLRHGFIAAHLAPGTETRFDFHKYIRRSLEEDFKVVVGISPLIWFLAVLILLTHTHGSYSYLWLPFIPLIVILMVSTKLQIIITRMGLRIQERGDVVKGTPVVQPGDDLFWFNNPRFMLFCIHFCLFLNAFQLAFFVWSWYEFGLISCYHQNKADVAIRISMGVLVQLLCSYTTLPLYALVTQMGSSMKSTIFDDRVATALKSWHRAAKKHTKHSKHAESTTPLSSRPGTPSGSQSPMHLLHNFRQMESYPNTPSRHQGDHNHWERDGSYSTLKDEDSAHTQFAQRGEAQSLEAGVMQLPPGPGPIRTSSQQHEINIGESDFSFDKSANHSA